MTASANERKKILIVGGGFAGLSCAKKLVSCPAAITLIDRHNYHLFQPLLYQVATAVLSPADIATPIRHILYKQDNIKVGLGELTGIDPAKRMAHFSTVDLSYDYLVLAAGAGEEYFGHDHWAQEAPSMKSIDDALNIRRRVLMAYEAAEWEADEDARRAKLTFVVVGGGPTGVEMAGALKEIAAQTIARDFRNIDTTTARVILVEGGDRLLAAMPPKLSARALKDLENMGVEVRLNSFVTNIGQGMIAIGNEQLAAENIIWAAGVRGVPVAETMGVELDRAGRVLVTPELTVPGYPEIFVVGDLAHAINGETGKPVPGVAPAAIQMGEYAARIIRDEIESGGAKSRRPPFRYHDKGAMATIGRNKAVAALGRMRLSGLPAWLLWGAVHLMPLVGFRNRLSVFLSWLWSYFSFSKNARLITGQLKMKVTRLRKD